MPRCSLREGGWESRCVDRTGKLDLRCRRLDQGSALGIERDGGDWRPVSGLPAPASWVAFPRLLIDRVAGLEQRPILAGMTLRRGDVADGASGARGCTVAQNEPSTAVRRQGRTTLWTGT